MRIMPVSDSSGLRNFVSISRTLTTISLCLAIHFHIPKYSEVVVNIMRCLRATVLLSIGFLVMRADAATRPHLLFSSESAFYNDVRQSQSQAGGLRVTVTDAQQHLLSGINCSLLLSSDLSTIVAKSATDRDGVATFHEVIVCEYILTVEGP